MNRSICLLDITRLYYYSVQKGMNKLHTKVSHHRPLQSIAQYRYIIDVPLLHFSLAECINSYELEIPNHFFDFLN